MRTLLATAAIATALFTAAPAGADQYDFITLLDNNGVSYVNILDMIDLGKQTCHEMRAGSDLNMVMDYLVEQEQFTNYEAGFILGAAASSMCPDVKPRLREHLNTPPPVLAELY